MAKHLGEAKVRAKKVRGGKPRVRPVKAGSSRRRRKNPK